MGVVFNVAINSCMQMAVLYEIASDLILSRSSIATTVRPLVGWASGLLLLLAVGLGAGFSGSHIERVVHAFEVLNFCANVINIGLLLALIMLTRVLHISWKSLSIGIVLGFAIDSSAEMGGISFISALGFRGVIPGDLVRMLGFLICTLVWMVYILLPEKQPILVGRQVQKSEIESWNEELQEIARR